MARGCLRQTRNAVQTTLQHIGKTNAADDLTYCGRGPSGRSPGGRVVSTESLVYEIALREENPRRASSYSPHAPKDVADKES